MKRLPVNKPYRKGKGYGALMFYGKHYGIDYLPRVPGFHEPIVSPTDGKYIRYVGGACQGIDIKGKDGFTHRLCHLNTVTLKLGQPVKAGSMIGTMGNRGLSIGVHLHHAVMNPQGKTIDPNEWLRLSQGNLDSLKGVVRPLFTQIWGVPPAKGDELYFIKRLEQGSIKPNRNDLIRKIKYWHSIVYKGGKLNKKGNEKWQRSKNEVLK